MDYLKGLQGRGPRARASVFNVNHMTGERCKMPQRNASTKTENDRREMENDHKETHNYCEHKAPT